MWWLPKCHNDQSTSEVCNHEVIIVIKLSLLHCIKRASNSSLNFWNHLTNYNLVQNSLGHWTRPQNNRRHRRPLALGIWMTPCKMQNLIYEWVDFSKFTQIWAKIGTDLRKFWKKRVTALKKLVQNWSDWYMNGSLFLEKLVFAWAYFQILQ